MFYERFHDIILWLAAAAVKQCQSPFCTVVSISSADASTTKSQIHSWKHKQNQTIWLWLSILTNQPSGASRQNCASCGVSLGIPRCWYVVSPPQHPQTRGSMKAFLCPGDSLYKNHPGSCWPIILLWTNAHSPPYCWAP